jgi:hypothetical protein
MLCPSGCGREKYFAATNSRTTVDFNLQINRNQSGFWIRKKDTLDMLFSISNSNNEPKDVFITIYYEYVETTPPSGWQNTKTVFLDAGQRFSSSNIVPPQLNGSFEVVSQPYTPKSRVRLVHVVGLLQTGGIEIEVKGMNSNRSCISQARYGESKQWKADDGSLHDNQTVVDKKADEQISSMGPCEGPLLNDRAYLSPNGSFQVIGRYDYGKHPGNLVRRSPEEVRLWSLMKT